MTGPELYEYYKVAYANAGRNIDDYYDPSTPNKPMTNWIEEVTRLGRLQDYEVNAQAGNDRGRFYSSLSFQDNQGVSYATSYKRLTGRVNSDYRLTRTLEIGTRFLTDYLNGDTYFKIRRPEQNLDRCRSQLKLVTSIEEQMDDMQKLLLKK